MQDFQFALFLFITLILSYYDIVYYRIPMLLVYGGIGVLFVSSALTYNFNAAFMLRLSVQILFAYYYLWAIRLISKKGMGMGDAYVSSFAMAFLQSFYSWFFALVAASLSALLCCLCFKKRKIYFVPFILCASAVVYFLRKII